MSGNQGPVLMVAGTRPEIIKLSPIIKWLNKIGVNYVFVWSGQHYDYEMSKIFFEQLKLPEPDENLCVRGSTHAEQTAKMMLRLEKIIEKYCPSIVISEGDTNTVLSASLTSLKCSVPFAHVEAGLRSWNMKMPEEINRKIADALAILHFAPTKLAVMNLLFEGVSPRGIHLTGNTIVDVIQEYREVAKRRGKKLISEFNLVEGEYILVTVHRAENTDNYERLKNIIYAFKKLTNHYDIVFPIHPRTKRKIIKAGLRKHLSKVKLLKPLGYFEFLGLLIHSKVVVTDSGGLQEEAFSLNVPIVTTRYNTERPETIMYGLNKLAGADKDQIVKLTLEQAKKPFKRGKPLMDNPLGDGRAGERTAIILKKIIQKGFSIDEPDLRKTPILIYKLLSSLDNQLNKKYMEVIAYFTSNGEVTFSRNRSLLKLIRVWQKTFNGKTDILS